MDLPLDHFRLLGVSPATDAQTVLRTLQLRLDRPPDDGYTVETLQARADLLRASADLLSDDQRRSAYESDLTALSDAEEPLMPALEIPSSREVAGLLLLLEAGQPLEAFQLASRSLQPPQAPALGSGREADLALLAGEAALAAAADQSQERHYELAARTLQQGLQLLQRMGQLPEIRERIHAELDALTPFRVLDLLSRDPAASRERQEGLALLEQLVERRGGLEGDRDASFPAEEFQTFFKQIRAFLTVQEQLDLFQGWGEQGSAAAAFLGTIALTASGFAQRKPERIAAARQRLLARGGEGTEPLLANLDLLLGDVEGAIQRFRSGAGAELRDWAERRSTDPLAQVCAWCRDWLARDVLAGYRDLEADPDLEAYFSDRDVLAWVEREDRRSGRGAAVSTAEPQPPSGEASLHWPSASEPEAPSWMESASVPGGEGLPWPSGPAPTSRPADRDALRQRRDAAPAESGGWFRGLPAAWSPPPLGGRVLLLAGGGLVLLLGAGWLLRLRTQPPAAPAAASRSEAPPQRPLLPPTASGSPSGADASRSSGPALAAAQPQGPQQQGLPLRSSDPTQEELQRLLERWLQVKSAVLAGEAPPSGLERLVRPGPLGQLERERQRDSADGRRQSIEVSVTNATVIERSPQRIALQAELGYRDQTLAAGGRVVERTPPTTLRNVYVFGRDGDLWRLAATRPAP